MARSRSPSVSRSPAPVPRALGRDDCGQLLRGEAKRASAAPSSGRQGRARGEPVSPPATTRRARLRVRRHRVGRKRVSVDLLRHDSGGLMPAAERLKLAHRRLEVGHDGPSRVGKRSSRRGPHDGSIGRTGGFERAALPSQSRRVMCIRRARCRPCGPPRAAVRQAELRKPVHTPAAQRSHYARGSAGRVPLRPTPERLRTRQFVWKPATWLLAGADKREEQQARHLASSAVKGRRPRSRGWAGSCLGASRSRTRANRR
jgi:hypothetical protein